MNLHTEKWVRKLPNVSHDLLLICDGIEIKLDHIKALEAEVQRAQENLYNRVKASGQWSVEEIKTVVHNTIGPAI